VDKGAVKEQSAGNDTIDFSDVRAEGYQKNAQKNEEEPAEQLPQLNEKSWSSAHGAGRGC